MGKKRKRFNWKAYLNSDLVSGESVEAPQETVEVDINVQEEKYDSSNPLVLLPKNKKSKRTRKVETPKEKKPLSKKQKRRLAKIIEKKRKKVDHAELLQKLQGVQATSGELEFMTSTSAMQTHGLKGCDTETVKNNASTTISNVKGSKRKKDIPPEKKLKLDPNIVGYESSGSDSEADENVIAHSDQDLEKNSTPHQDVIPSLDSKTVSNEHLEASLEDSEPSKCDQTGRVIEKSTAILQSSSEKKKDETCHEPTVFVPVYRAPEIQCAREALPIYSEEQAIMEAIRENSVVVIHGATGSGKTTQVPQFLYEAGYTKNKKLIGITEPRRIAAVQMAARVAEEMNLPDSVSYHIRYEKTSTEDKTEIKFMTDGVLLKEIRHDFLLTRYSVIIIDEAHERSVFSDVLIGLLSRILPLREKKGSPLKLVIMSATLCVEDFTENMRLFREKPFLIKVDSRQYDVVLHFSTKTPVDYIQGAYDKVSKIHRQLPSGAILVFVTGEKEVTRLCKLLRKSFPFKTKCQSETPATKKELQGTKKGMSKRLRKCKNDDSFSDLPPKIDLDDYSIEPLDNESMQHQDSDDETYCSDDDDDNDAKCSVNNSEPLYVLPLYSVLPSEEQAKIFCPPPLGCRLCVVATNVAETSITIPGLKYVVDTGKVKTRVYDKIACGVSHFAITWTSKASANQRAGRAGRTEGGHCYRLYSSSVFQHEFPEFTPPDIQRIPVDDILLQMKALGIDRVVNFPFPTPPDVESLKAAEKRLVKLGALQDLVKGSRYKDINKWEYSAKVTPLGKAMSRFPLSPRFAKMLLLSYKHDVVPYIIAVVSAMTVPEVFLNSALPDGKNGENVDDDDDEQNQKLWSGIKKIGAGQGKSRKFGDAMVLLRAVAIYEESRNQAQLCSKYGIRQKAMLEIHKMRLQLIREMNRSFCDLDIPLDLRLEAPNDETIEVLRKILTSSLTDHVARKVSQDQVQKGETNCKGAYKCLDLDELVYIHPSSVLSNTLPEFVVYQDIFQTSKYFMRTVIEIEPEWLTAFATNQCEFSPPLETPAPHYDKKTDKIMCSMTSTFGHFLWELPCVVMPMPQGITKYTWFCFFLLDGQVCPILKQYKQHLISPANVMLKQWARLLPRTRSLLQAVVDKEIDSRAALHKVWDQNSNYLLSEYCEWLPESKHMDVTCKWPPRKEKE